MFAYGVLHMPADTLIWSTDAVWCTEFCRQDSMYVNLFSHITTPFAAEMPKVERRYTTLK